MKNVKSDKMNKKSLIIAILLVFVVILSSSSVFAEDIRIISRKNSLIHNFSTCYLGDVRQNINRVPDGVVDLIITSPPYLNSRDNKDI